MMRGSFFVKVRHNVKSALEAEVVRDERGGVKLLACRPRNGPFPGAIPYIGMVFPDLKVLRNVLVAMLRGNEDVLDWTVISAAAYLRWLQLTGAKASVAVAFGVCGADVPDAQATVLSTGELSVWVDVPHAGRVVMIVPRAEWAWRT